MRTVDSRPFMRDFSFSGASTCHPGAAHGAALDAEPRASCRASSARLAVGATAATARWSLARRTRPLPRTLVRAGPGVRARRRLLRLLCRVTRPWRPSPRVVWWDSTGSSRSPGRSTRCARYARTPPRLRPGPRPTTTAPRSSVIEQPTTAHNEFSPRPVSTQLPHKVKARKEIQAWPLKVKLGAEYDLVAKKFKATRTATTASWAASSPSTSCTATSSTPNASTSARCRPSAFARGATSTTWVPTGDARTGVGRVARVHDRTQTNARAPRGEHARQQHARRRLRRRHRGAGVAAGLGGGVRAPDAAAAARGVSRAHGRRGRADGRRGRAGDARRADQRGDRPLR